MHERQCIYTITFVYSTGTVLMPLGYSVLYETENTFVYSFYTCSLGSNPDQCKLLPKKDCIDMGDTPSVHLQKNTPVLTTPHIHRSQQPYNTLP
jgi:hypothetical protein